MSDKVVIYSAGIVGCCACADSALSGWDVEDAVNIIYPTGIDSMWSVAEDDFATGQPNPCPCDKDPGRTHWSLTC